MAHQKTSSNPNDFILPDLGEGVHEAELIKWRVKVGQQVNEHDILAEMETDKALVEVPSPRAGVISALHGTEGEVLKVGNALVTFAGSEPGGASPRSGAKGSPASQPASPAPKAPVPSSNGSHAPGAAAEEDAGTVVGKVGGSLAGITAEAGKALATPAVRRLARDLGVDIDSIAGRGIGGRVLEKDVRAASGGSREPRAQARGGVAEEPIAPRVRPAPPAPIARPARAPEPALGTPSAPARRETPSFASNEAIVRIPFRGVRRTIANRLQRDVRISHRAVADDRSQNSTQNQEGTRS